MQFAFRGLLFILEHPSSARGFSEDRCRVPQELMTAMRDAKPA